MAGHGLDNNVEWDGLRHDSRDLLYRTPGGAVPAGTPVTLRFRTFHNDVTGVKLRVYDLNANAPAHRAHDAWPPATSPATRRVWRMTPAISGQATLPNDAPE